MSGTSDVEPRHIAIIMDGNGRWANARGLPRQVGHERGVEALRNVVEACRPTSLSHLTVFSFSSENWKRPAAEISALFGLLKIYVAKDLNRLHSEGVKIRIIGSKNGLPGDILELIKKAEDKTKANTKFHLNIAFNYGAQDEIVEASRAIAARCVSGDLRPEDISNDVFARELLFKHSPDPDLLIRTSGEYRISNFLLWQIAYSELYFTDCLWPDFGEAELHEALNAFKARDRRFGSVKAST